MLIVTVIFHLFLPNFMFLQLHISYHPSGPDLNRGGIVKRMTFIELISYLAILLPVRPHKHLNSIIFVLPCHYFL